MRRPLALLALPCVVVMASCGTAVTTSSYKGASHEVAQTIADLQSHVTGGEQDKICSDDLAAEVVGRLGGKKACEKATKDQLSQIDSTTLTIESVHLAGSGTTAAAKVSSTFEGKTRKGVVVELVKQGKRWKVSAVH